MTSTVLSAQFSLLDLYVSEVISFCLMVVLVGVNLYVKGSRARVVKHILFENWPDFGCPKSPEELNNLVLSVRSHLPHKDHGPIVVHCR